MYSTDMKKRFLSVPLIVLMMCIIAAPEQGLGATHHDLEVAGWIPYWRDSEGIKDAKEHLSDIDTVYPFAFTVKQDGTLADQADLDDREWRRFIRDAGRKDVEVIPTIMWADGANIHRILSDRSLRKKHVNAIVDMVEDGRYDGVNIDYESKKSETIDYFSLFLKELKGKLDNQLLTCAIEARTPPESLYRVIPNPIRYANDYKEIAKYCDRVELMTYDQQRADLLLNVSKSGAPYMPVSDADWVRKVVEFALEDFEPEQIMLGIPTYGNHYEITVAPNWFRDYKRIGALNVPDILDVAEEYNVTPSRNKAGEMSFTYLHKTSPYFLPSALIIPEDTPSGNIIAARALQYANMTGQEMTFRYASYSDAGAMKQKIDLAKEYELRGVALFKIDGEEDQEVWEYLD